MSVEFDSIIISKMTAPNTWKYAFMCISNNSYELQRFKNWCKAEFGDLDSDKVYITQSPNIVPAETFFMIYFFREEDAMQFKLMAE